LIIFSGNLSILLVHHSFIRSTSDFLVTSAL
jgi:hypothetical protein